MAKDEQAISEGKAKAAADNAAGKNVPKNTPKPAAKK